MNKKSRKFYLFILGVLLVLAAGIYAFRSHSQPAVINGDIQHNAEASNALPEGNFAGTYTSDLGANTIEVAVVDASHIRVTGTAILAGAGNSADTKTLESRTGKLSGVVKLDGSSGTYTDPSDPECTLQLHFSTNDLQISGGENCDVTIANFSSHTHTYHKQ